MDVPGDEKGLVTFVIDKFEAQRTHYEDLMKKYDEGNNYPDYNELKEGIELTNDILSKKKEKLDDKDVEYYSVNIDRYVFEQQKGNSTTYIPKMPKEGMIWEEKH